MLVNTLVAVTLDIGMISLEERVEIRFNASEDWVGEFELSVYNSPAKNSVVKPNALTVSGKLMLLVIEPLAQQLVAKTHYYEIVEKRSKRILFKGNLTIIK